MRVRAVPNLLRLSCNVGLEEEGDDHDGGGGGPFDKWLVGVDVVVPVDAQGLLALLPGQRVLLGEDLPLLAPLCEVSQFSLAEAGELAHQRGRLLPRAVFLVGKPLERVAVLLFDDTAVELGVFGNEGAGEGLEEEDDEDGEGEHEDGLELDGASVEFAEGAGDVPVLPDDVGGLRGLVEVERLLKEQGPVGCKLEGQTLAHAVLEGDEGRHGALELLDLGARERADLLFYFLKACEVALPECSSLCASKSLLVPRCGRRILPLQSPPIAGLFLGLALGESSSAALLLGSC